MKVRNISVHPEARDPPAGLTCRFGVRGEAAMHSSLPLPRGMFPSPYAQGEGRRESYPRDSLIIRAAASPPRSCSALPSGTGSTSL